MNKVNTALKNNDAMVSCNVFQISLPTATQYAFINTSMVPIIMDFGVKPFFSLLFSMNFDDVHSG